MSEQPNKTRAYIAIYRKDEEGYGFGCELIDNNRNEDFHIFSLYLPRDEYPNIRQIIHRLVPIILAEIPDDHVAVTFYSTFPNIRNRRELIRKNGKFAVGKTLDFKEVPQVRRTAIMLAIDAVKRGKGYSITERL